MSTDASNRILAELICQAASIHRESNPNERAAVSRVVLEVGRMADRLARDGPAGSRREAAA